MSMGSQVALGLVLISSMLSSGCGGPVMCTMDKCPDKELFSSVRSTLVKKDADIGIDPTPEASQVDPVNLEQQEDMQKKIQDILSRLDLAEALSSLQEKSMELFEQRLQALEGRDEDAGTLIQRLADQLSELEASQAQNQSSITDIKMQIDTLKAQFVSFQATQIAYSETLASTDLLQQSIRDMQSLLRTEHNEMGTELRLLITSEVNALAESIAELPRIQDMSRRLDQLELGFQNLTASVGSLSTDFSATQEEVRTLELQLGGLLSQYQNEIPQILTTLSVLEQAQAPGCTLGEPLQRRGGERFRTLTCGSQSIEIKIY